jgi:DNA-binding NarL/FixJ family response regulator
MKMEKINIAIADDHKIFREGLIELLSKERHLNVIGGAGTRGELLDIVQHQLTHIVIMDIDMGKPMALT